jgi:hypothetical protein
MEVLSIGRPMGTIRRSPPGKQACQVTSTAASVGP